jgi:hypothetical protein
LTDDLVIVEATYASALPTRLQCSQKAFCFFGDPAAARGDPNWIKLLKVVSMVKSANILFLVLMWEYLFFLSKGTAFFAVVQKF